MTKSLVLVAAVMLFTWWLARPWAIGLERRVAFDTASSGATEVPSHFVFCLDDTCQRIPVDNAKRIDSSTYVIPIRVRPGKHAVVVKACLQRDGANACSAETSLTAEVKPEWTWKGWE